MGDNPYRQLPSTARLLEHPALAELRGRVPHEIVAEAIRDEIDLLRASIATRVMPTFDEASLMERIASRIVDSAKPRLRPVINATGIVLHTNLGRSPMAESAAKAAYDAARGYLALELDLASGERSSRQNPIRDGVRRITGAESATAVNNCAAATVIVLRALAAGREVIVSRGQLIEIGGSFRIPDIMTASGATLREVGTTNITRLSDYEAAIGPNTAALMRVHCSNYRVRGFTEAVSIADLAALGQKHNLTVIDDVGSGSAFDLAPFGFPGEPTIREGIAAGADLVLFSGDKLLGGPQAGIIAGKKKWIGSIERDPLMRAFRLDKMTLAALEATLAIYRDPPAAMNEVPTLRMLSMPLVELRERSGRFHRQLKSIPGVIAEIHDDGSFVGGGSLPDQSLPTVVVTVDVDGLSAEAFSTQLRVGSPAVVARIQNDRVLIDLRTVLEGQDEALIEAIRTAAASVPMV